MHFTPAQARAAGDAQRDFIRTAQSWLDTNVNSAGQPLPAVARPHIERWIQDSIGKAIDWYRLAQGVE